MDNFNFPVTIDGCSLKSDKVKSAHSTISESKLDAMILDSGLTKVAIVNGFWKNKDKSKVAC